MIGPRLKPKLYRSPPLGFEKAADHTLRMVTIGQLILFSIETGNA
jgi:hypothetical protein